MTEEVLTPSQIAEIFIFYWPSTVHQRIQTLLLEEREITPLWRGGGVYELLMALYFIFLNNLNTFFKKNSILLSL